MSPRYPDAFLASLELQQDLLFDRIPHTLRGQYVDQALAIGQRYASECPNVPLTMLFEQAKITLDEQGQSGKLFTTKLRAQYEEGPHGQAKITYYQESINALAESANISYQQALDIHLAHEYFHYLELRDHQPVNERLPRVPLRSLFGWKRTATILRTSEIAANAFAKNLLRLSTLPNYYDYLYLMNQGKIPKDWLDTAYADYQVTW